MQFLRKHAKKFGIFATLALSVGAWAYTYTQGYSTVYNDAMSHLNIARLVVDNQQTGLSQMGSVWLPLMHVLMLPLVWIDWAWHSGFAGSFVSMLAFVGAVAGVYGVIAQLVKPKIAAVVGAAAFALNINALYLQSTPLTEMLYVGLFVASCLYLIKYLKTDSTKSLLALSFFTALQILTRYDGWFVAIIFGAILLINEIWIKKQGIKRGMGNMYLYAFPVGFAVLLWLAWNFVFFHDALYAFTGPYSAHAQQEVISQSGGLITKGDWGVSLNTFWVDMRANIGVGALIVGAIGWAAFMLFQTRLKPQGRLFAFIAVMSVIVFNILALVLGFSIINLPELGWNPSGTTAGALFNVRYGILALPFAAIGIGLLAGYRRYVWIAAMAVVLLQAGILVSRPIITLEDGLHGSSAFVNQDVAVALKNNVKPTDTVLMSTSSYNAVAFQSSLALHQFIHEGVSAKWNDAVASPDKYVQWIVMANGDVGDPVYHSLVVNEKSAFLRYYKVVFTGDHANIYERKTTSEVVASVSNGSVIIHDQPYDMRGVNSYDLAYRSPSEIDNSLAMLEKNNVNTVRFWLFGDGRADGVQPTAGTINDAMMRNIDYLMVSASQHNIRLIPVLTNNWQDYGGIEQYLAWSGLPTANHNLFFSDKQPRDLFKNYLNHIITRTNTFSGAKYADDPTILQWELINEPRTSNDDNALIARWAGEMGSYLKTLDSNHLVSIGLDKSTFDTGLRTICDVKQIDVCSIHIYASDKGALLYPNLQSLDDTLKKAAQIAQDINKPITIGEIGVSKTEKLFGEQPLALLGDIITAIDADNYRGVLIWNWSITPDSSFGFSPKGTNNTYNIDDLAKLLAK